MLDDLDLVVDASGQRHERKRRTKRKGHDKPDPTVIPPAFLLTNEVAEDLAAGLDASDVLECYWLTRRVFLQGVANQTISVSKTALGLRYRPPPWANENNPHKREIVLEYGPDRAGSKNENDVLPVLIPSDADGNGVAETSYVSWHNEGRVFYSQEIHALQYESATYMASVTGSVVADVLQQAARYPAQRGSRRYQPWQVMLVHNTDTTEDTTTTEETATVKLRSSSDVDFIMDLMQRLATLGVDLLPVLRPTIYSLELTVQKVSRETVTPTTKAGMAVFYEKLYACVDQLASGQPASRTSVAKETVSPTPAPVDPTPVNPSTAAPTVAAGGGVNDGATQAPSYGLEFTTASPSPASRMRILQSDGSELVNNETSVPTLVPTATPTHVPTWRVTSQPSVVVPPSPADPPPSSAASDAQKAAEEAHKAVQNATDIESAAQAAQQAVDAAQQAVDVTVTQEALLRKEALMSGNSEEMTLAVSLCFSDPIYGIRSSAANASSTPAYLYWDASYYFSLELVHPYVRVVPTTWTAPTPVKAKVSAFSPDSTFVDWSLVLFYVILGLLGLLLLAQRISPSSALRSQWLYKYQRWFFDPMHHNFDDAENDEVKRAESRPLGRDGIPYSMSGREQRPAPLYVGGNFRRNRAASKDILFKQQSSSGGSNGVGTGDDVVSAPGDVEMVAQSKSVGSIHGGSLSDLGEDEFMDEGDSTVSHRLFRDPEMVDLPDLTSSSKVAIPVSLRRSNSGTFSID
uniref:Uncharacterized protein n=1 Tax=Amphora coffeiformis TaxID=265554 RepID=A0A7S3P8I9_9STRA|mmetsp:Transcript_9631/g.18378  ORF Transcript_9631/g.18378 Transcript_9631/m.18378 type:complete len:747 (+) Transcript_9631:281-2521(+)|eukprot:scaffold4510_cov183-Amphora_coffeaeformis.AAC.51